MLVTEFIYDDGAVKPEIRTGLHRTGLSGNRAGGRPDWLKAQEEELTSDLRFEVRLKSNSDGLKTEERRNEETSHEGK